MSHDLYTIEERAAMDDAGDITRAEMAAASSQNPDDPYGETLDGAALQVEDFWDERKCLAHIRDFARARMTSPWAVLGVALARAITTIPPYVVLPPLIGSDASLNLYVALVGPSGMGKGAATGAAKDAVDLGDVFTATVGSGEGVAHLYSHWERGSVVRDRSAVLFTVPEVDMLTALGSRQGATLLSTPVSYTHLTLPTNREV